jgi:uncharacterized membrane protein
MATSLDTGNDVTAGTERGVGTALGTTMRPRQEVTAPYQRMADEDRGTGGESLSDFLGYFSLGLGLAEVLAPTAVARLIGIKHPNERNRTTLRLMGLREITSGIAILSNQQPKKAVMSRVAGDARDNALLGATLANPENDRGRTLFATANVLAVTALDVMASKSLAKQPETVANEQMDKGIIRTKRSITVQRPVEEVYEFWHNFENLPRFMRHLESVRKIDDRRSHWVAKAPAGKAVEWDAETTEDRPNELIAWRSLPGSKVYNAGEVRFVRAPGDRGTELRVTLEYDPPFGKLGSKVAMLWREEPGQQVADDLRHFKQVMETGEIVLSDSTKQRGPHPAKPNNKPVEL